MKILILLNLDLKTLSLVNIENWNVSLKNIINIKNIGHNNAMYGMIHVLCILWYCFSNIRKNIEFAFYLHNINNIIFNVYENKKII